MSMITIEDLKGLVQEIPPLPAAATRLLEMCRDPEISSSEIVEVISRDPALTMKVLRLSNSPFYGLPRQVNSLSDAVVYLGSDALVNFVLAGCMSEQYEERNDGYGLDEGELARHALASAICAQKVAEIAAPELATPAFTCGLLHDVGKIILNRIVAESLTTMLQLVETQNISFLDAENLVLGFTHSTAGAAVAEHWTLPTSIVESIRYHHEPLAASAANHKLVALTHVGDVLCVSFGIGVGSNGMAYSFHPGALRVLGLEIEDLFALAVEVNGQLIETEATAQIA